MIVNFVINCLKTTGYCFSDYVFIFVGKRLVTVEMNLFIKCLDINLFVLLKHSFSIGRFFVIVIL